MTTIYVGRRVTGPEVDRGELDPQDMRACVYEGPDEHVWAHTFEAWLGRLTGASTSVRFGLYDPDPQPDARIAYSAQATVSAAYGDITGGAKVSAAVAVNDRGPSVKGVPISMNEAVAIAVLNTGAAALSHSMRAAASISEPDENFYDRAGVAAPPPSPYGATVGVNNGHVSSWLVCDENEAPVRGINRSPSGLTTETVFTARWDFRDRNGAWGPGNGGADRGDYVRKYGIQLQRLDGSSWTTILDKEYVATAAEIAASKTTPGQPAKHVNRTPDISALTPDDYRWRQQDADHFGTYYAWSDTDWVAFTVGAAGLVTVDGSPSGSRVTDNTPDIQARWHHAAGLAMTHARVQLLDFSTNDVIDDSGWVNVADVASSASPGTLFTMTAAQTGFGALPWGTRFKYQVAGRDSAGAETPYSARRAFTTNYAPTVPSNLTPASSGPFTEPPELTAKFSDQDDTPAGSGSGTQALTGVFRLDRPTAATIDLVPSWDPVRGVWFFPLTAAQLTEFGTYVFTATGFDGDLYSGEQTTLAAAVFSGTATFVYAAGPTVTVTAPADESTVVGAELAVEWTPSAQASWRVVMYHDGTDTVRYDSLWRAEPARRAWTIPPGSYDNEADYDLLVGVRDSLGLEGWSQVVDLHVSFTPPPTLLDLVIEPGRELGDPFDTLIRGTWTPSQEEGFRGYIVYRSASGGPDQGKILWAEISSQSQSGFVDYVPASGYEYTYQVSQVVDVSGAPVVSDPVEGSAMVELRGVVLASVSNPAVLRSVLQRTGPGRTFRRRKSEAVYYPPASAHPRTVRRRTRFQEPALSFQLITEGGLTYREQRWRLEALDEADETVCYRDDEQRKMFVTMPIFDHGDELVGWTSGELGLRQEGFKEGVAEALVAPAEES